MECPNIPGLALSDKSVNAIKRIRDMREIGAHLPRFLVAGNFVNIFAGNGPLQSSCCAQSKNEPRSAK